MTTHNAAMPHGSLQEVFPNVFIVMGTMRNEFFGSMWQFGRNMTVVRDGGSLTLINAVRLDEAGLADLDALGKVEHVMQIGSMHGHDDRFYVDRYDATMWSVEGMPQEEGLSVDRWMTEGGELPFSNAKLFLFKETKLPEAIVFLDQDDGIAIACDALQNWEIPDPFTDASTVATMKSMGFYAPCNLGPAWVHGFEPQPGDFAKLKGFTYANALVAHGTPVIGNASTRFAETFHRVFGV